MTRKAHVPSQRRLRLIPVTIVAALALLVVRAGELSLGIELSPTRPALAAEDDAATTAPDKRVGSGTVAPAGAATAPDGDGRSTDFPVEFTPAEVAVLQDLANRRDALLQLEKDLQARELLLSAAESRLDKRIGELQQLRDSIEALLRRYTEQEQAELESVVKIYETMKPKDAARILEELEMRILLGIMEKMKERKTAPILAAMGAERAREVTAELARKRAFDLSTPSDDGEPSG